MALVTLHCQIVLQRRMHIWHTFCTCGERKCKNTFSLSSNASLLAARTNYQQAEGDSGLAKWVKLVRSGETRKYGAVVRRPATRSTTSAAAAASADLEEHRYTAFDSQSWSKIDPWVAGMCMSNRIWGRTEVGFRGPARSVARFPIISVRHYFRSRHSFFFVCVIWGLVNGAAFPAISSMTERFSCCFCNFRTCLVLKILIVSQLMFLHICNLQYGTSVSQFRRTKLSETAVLCFWSISTLVCYIPTELWVP